MVLSEEQRQRIELNKALAEEKRRQLKKEKVVGNVCEKCASADILPMYLENFGEQICKKCASGNADFELLNKTTVMSEYLLPDDTCRHLRHKTKDNPHRKSWSEMKLFLRRHARAESYRRWGGEEELLLEVSRRKGQKLEREFTKAKAGAGVADGNWEGALLGAENDDGLSSSASTILARMLDQGDILKASASISSSKRQREEDAGTIKLEKQSSLQTTKSGSHQDTNVAAPKAKVQKKRLNSHMLNMLGAIRGKK